MSASDQRGRARADATTRTMAGAALVVSLAALVFSMGGSAPARPDGQPAAHAAARGRGRARQGGRGGRGRGRALPGASTRPRPYGILRLNARRRFPASAIPTVASAREAQQLDGATRAQLELGCRPTTVDMGTWCLDSSTYPLQPEEVGRNDFAFATRACVEQGGYLPTAAQLLGAASRVKLSSTIDDNETGASIDIDRTDGFKDQREMSATLFTVATGGSAAGSQGVTAGSRGDPRAGEPDPLPMPADPRPDTTYYMTVYDNRDQGGLAGGQPLGRAERFRCAYDKSQGAASQVEE